LRRASRPRHKTSRGCSQVVLHPPARSLAREKQCWKQHTTKNEDLLAALEKARTKLTSDHDTEITTLKRKYVESEDGKFKVEQCCVTAGLRNDTLTDELANMTAIADGLKGELEDAQGLQQDMTQFDRRRCDYIDRLKQQLQAAGLKPAVDPMG
jgi:hypothetical protein